MDRETDEASSLNDAHDDQDTGAGIEGNGGGHAEPSVAGPVKLAQVVTTDPPSESDTPTATAATEEAAVSATFVSTEGAKIVLPVGANVDTITVRGDDILLVQKDGSLIVIVDGVQHPPTLVIGGIEIPADTLAQIISNAEQGVPTAGAEVPESNGLNVPQEDAPVTATFTSSDGAKIVLPAGVSIDTVMVRGDDLILVQEDGSIIVIIDGAKFPPTLVLGGIEIPHESLAAIISGLPEGVPAAGPSTSQVVPDAGPEQIPSSGAEFSVVNPGIGEPFPIGDLLPPTALEFFVPEVKEDEPGFLDDGGPANLVAPSPPIFSLALFGTIEEDDLVVSEVSSLLPGDFPFSGNDEDGSGTPQPGNTVLVRPLGIDFGSDGPGSLKFVPSMNGFQPVAPVNGVATPVTSNGDPITYVLSQNGTLLTAVAHGDEGDRTVFTVKLNLSVPGGEFIVTLFDNLDHDISLQPPAGDPNADSGEGNLLLAFAVVATDGAGESATGAFGVLFQDDVPIIGFTFQSEGEDGPTQFVFGPESSVVDEDGLPHGVGDSTAPGDHPATSASSSGSLAILWGSDDGNSNDPTATFGDRKVYFKEGSAAANVSATNQLGDPISALQSQGQDVHYVLINGQTLVAYIGDTPPTEADVSSIDAQQPGSIVFVVTLNDVGNGSYTFTLYQELDHPFTSDPGLRVIDEGAPGGYEDDINLTFKFTAEDSDGDTASSEFNVLVDDDSPIATGETLTFTVDEDDIDTNHDGIPGGSLGTSPDDGNGDGSYTGNPAVTTGGPANVSGSLASLASSGADVPLTFMFIAEADVRAQLESAGLRSQGGPLSYDVQGNVLYAFVNDGNTIGEHYGPQDGDRLVFKLTLNPNGEFSFELFDQVDHDPPYDSDPAGFNNEDNPNYPGNTPLADQNTDLIDHDDVPAGQSPRNYDIDEIDLGGIIKAVDYDGDAVVLDGHFLIQIRDDIPQLKHGAKIVATVDEDDIDTAQSHGTSVDDGNADGSYSGSQSTENGDNPNFLEGPANISGSLASLVVPGADEPLNFHFVSESDVRSYLSGLGLSSQGEELSYDVDGGVLYGFANQGGTIGQVFNEGDDRLVFKLTVNGDGSFTFELHDQLDHDVPSSGADQNTDLQDGIPGDVEYINFGHVLQATDYDGDSVSLDDRLLIRIRDDIPQLKHGAKIVATVDEDDIDTAQSHGTSVDDGNADGSYSGSQSTENGDNPNFLEGPANISGSLASLVVPGADETLNFHFVSESDVRSYLSGLGLSSQGEELSYDVDGGVLYGFANQGGTIGQVFNEGDDRLVFKLTVNADGSFTFELHDQLDHDVPSSGADQNTDLQDGISGDVEYINFGHVLQATDYDGDSVSLDDRLLIRIRDDIPQVHLKIVNGNDNVTVDESAGTQNDDTTAPGVINLFNSVLVRGTDPDMSAPQYAHGSDAVVAATVVPGADEVVSVEYSLQIVGGNGSDSGLTTTDGRAIHLFLENGIIVGRYDKPNDGDTDINQPGHPDPDPAAFAIHIDSSGHISVAQFVSLSHPNTGSNDEDITFSSDTFLAKVTVVDFDGDTVTDTVDISREVRFDDDGPQARFALSGSPIIHDETVGVDGGTNDVAANLSSLFTAISNKGNDPHESAAPEPEIGYAQSSGAIVSVTADFGADGPAAGGGIAYAIDVPGGSNAQSGLQTTEGLNIRLFEVNSTLIVGRYEVGGNNNPDGSGNEPAAFAIHIDPDTGVVTVVQYVSLKHDDRGDPNEANDNGTNANDAAPNDIPDPIQQWLNDGALRVTVTVTDGDGDSVSQQYNIGNKIIFLDDGPRVSIAATEATVSHDETPGNDADAQDTSAIAVANLFNGVTNTGDDPHVAGTGAIGFAQSTSSLVTVTAAFGVDGPAAANSQVLSLIINGGNGTASGLRTTAGQNILLYSEGDLIVGRVSGGDDNGKAAFAIAIGQDGNVSIAQYLSLEHPTGGTSYDEPVSIAANKILAQVVVTDGDGDPATGTVDISGKIGFQDDGPVVQGVQPALGPELIVNGSFEQGHGLGGSDWETFHEITGWTSNDNGTPDPSDDIPFEVQTGNVGDLAAQDGNAKVELDSDTEGNPDNPAPDNNQTEFTNTIIQQVVAGTEAGETYQLTFWYAPRPNDGDPDSSSMNVLWNGVVVHSVDSSTAPAGWQQITVQVTATGPNSVLGFQGTGQANELGAFIDNVSLKAIVVLDDEDTDFNPLNNALTDIGIQGGPGDDGHGVSGTGKILFDAGADGLKQIAFTDAAGAPQVTATNSAGDDAGPLKVVVVDPTTHAAHQEDISYQWTPNGTGGGTLVGYSASYPVATPVFTVNVAADGSYTFNLLAPLAHPFTDPDFLNNGPETAFEDNLQINIAVTVTDGDNDIATTSITINIDDDTPDATGESASASVNEDALDNTGEGGTSESFVLDFQGGTHTLPPDLSGTNLNLSGGPGIVVVEFAGVKVLQGPDAAGGTGASSLFVNANPGTTFEVGSFNLGLFGAGTASVTLRGYDAGGNEIATVVVPVTLVPYLGAEPATVFNAVGTALEGLALSSLEIDPAAGFSGRVVVDNFGFTSISGGGAPDPVQASIDLTPLVAFGADGADADAAFALKTFTAQNFGTVTADGQQVQIVSDGTTLTGFIEGPTAAPGDDIPVFTVEVSSGGTVTFTLLQPLDHGGQDPLSLNFGGYIVATDGDGDGIMLPADAVVFNVNDDGPTLTTTSVAVDEDGLAAGIGDSVSPGDAPATAATQSGTLGIDFGADGPDAPTELVVSLTSVTTADPATGSIALSSNGQPVTTVWDDATNTLTGSAGSDPVFTLVVNNDGTYTFKLWAQLDHPSHDSDGNNDGDPQSAYEDDIVLNFTATATDNDGTTGQASFTVTVDDDTPVLVPDAMTMGLANEASLGGTASDVNLVVNGSFEDTSLASSTSFGFFGGLAGWTQNIDAEIVDNGFVGMPSSDGQHWIDMGTSGSQKLDISQSINGMTTGQTYELSFDAGTWNSTSGNVMEVYFGGVLIDTIAPDGPEDTYEDRFVFSITGGSGDGSNVLRFVGTAGHANEGVVLDNVRIVALDGSVPVPATADLSTLVDFGADGADATPFSLKAFAAETFGDVQAEGQAVLIASDGATLTGFIDDGANPGNGVFDGDETQVFTVTLNGNTAEFTLLHELDHPTDTDPIELDFGAFIVATDGDGDQVMLPGGSVIFKVQDGIPSIVAVASDAMVVHDETAGIQPDTDANPSLGIFPDVLGGISGPLGNDPDVPGSLIGVSHSTAPIVNVQTLFGPDGPAAASHITYAVSATSNGVFSGLQTTEGADILLFNETTTDGDPVVVGRVGDAAGVVAFAFGVDPDTGVMALVQYLSINHDNTNDQDEAAYLAANTVVATATVTDGDNDVATSNAVDISGQIKFEDDGPSLDIAGDPVTVAESTSADGTWTVAPGSDGANSVNVTAGSETKALSLTGPSNVVFDLAEGTLTVSWNGSTGTWQFQAGTDIDNDSPPPDTVSFTISVTDGDDDQVSDTQIINIIDGTDPSGGDLAILTVKESDLDTTQDPSDLAAGTETGSTPSGIQETASGSITFNAGTDALTNFAFGPTVTIVVYDSALNQIPGIVWSLNGSGQLDGKIGGETAILLDFAGGPIPANTTGTISVVATLTDNFPHTGAGADAIVITGIQVQASDHDGDTVYGAVNVRVIDDTPTAVADTDTVVEGQTATGNVITDIENDGGKDTQGADGATVTAIQSDNLAGPVTAVPGAGTVINGQYGQLTINPDGSYSYVANGNISNASAVTDVFNYTLTDGDGDVSTTTLTISIEDGTDPSVISGTAIPVDEEGLGTADATGTNPASPVEANAGTVSFQAGTDNIVSVAFQSVAGITVDVNGVAGPDIAWTLVGPTQIIGKIGLLDAIQIDLTPLGLPIAAGGTGSATVTVTLLDNFPHPNAGGENIITLNGLSVVATDTDSDSVSAPVTVTVTDDVPQANIIVDFDNIGLGDGDEAALTSPHEGFNFVQTGVYNPPGTVGYSTYAPHSNNNVAFIGEKDGIERPGYDGAAGDPITITKADGSDFVPTGAWFSAPSIDNLQLTITAYRDGNVVGTLTPTINTGAGGGPTFVDFSSFGIVDTLTFDSAPGASSQYFGFDDFSYNLIISADEDQLTAGNQDATTSPGDDGQANLTGTLAFEPGADGATVAFSQMTGAVTGNFADGNGQPVTSGGSALIWAWIAATSTLYATTAANPADADDTNSAFKIVVDPTTGDYTFTLLDQLDHHSAGTEDNIDIKLSYTVTDGDGDTATGTIWVSVDDDLPVADISLNGNATLALDETIGGADTPADDTTSTPFAAYGQAFGVAATAGAVVTDNSAYGADGPGAVKFALTDANGDTIDGVNSGLEVTNGDAIFLFTDADGLIVGREGPDAATAETGAVAFVIGIDGSGVVTVAQYLAIDHGDGAGAENGTTGADEAASLANLVHVTQTVTDGDGDTSTATSDTAIAVEFQDDGPSASAHEPAVSGFTYNPETGHFYMFVEGHFDWLGAKAGAEAFGGYLATVTSAQENAFVVSLQVDGSQQLIGGAWLGGSDAETEGVWKWVTGPEGEANGGTGTIFWDNGTAILYANWNGGEPNGGPGVDHIHFFPLVPSYGPIDTWNDLNQDDAYPGDSEITNGYVVEIGGLPGDPNAVIVLDDDAFTGGNAGGTGDDVNAAQITGTLGHNYGTDGPGAITLLNSIALPAGFTGVLSAGNSVLTISQGATPVLVITITDAVTGAYSVSQLAPMDHPAGGDENNLNFVIGYLVTDGDGDTANGTFAISVDDDTPVVTTPTLTHVDEDDLLSAPSTFAGNSDIATGDNLGDPSPTSVTGSFGVAFGADGPGAISALTVSAAGADAPGTPIALTSQGDAVTLVQDGSDATLWHGYANEGGPDQREVFQVQFNTGTGQYSFTLLDNLDHPINSTEDNLLLSFGFTATDGDGDSVAGTFTVDVDDDMPTLTGATIDMPELTEPGGDTLAGMGLVNQWTDFENQTGELPLTVWGTSDTEGADRIGMSVTFANGLTGTITYSGVSGLWNTSNFPGIAADSATGFFTAASGLHFLVNNSSTLPAAWQSFGMPFSSNFDLDYNDQGGSHFRASVAGWESAVFKTYSSAASASGSGPVSATLDLSALVAFGADGAETGGGFGLATVAAQDYGTLEADGQQVRIVSDGTTLTGFVDSGATTPNNGSLDGDDLQVFRLSVSPDGTATFTLLHGLDHGGLDQLALDFGPYITATDGDGDTIALPVDSVVFKINEGDTPFEDTGDFVGTVEEEQLGNNPANPDGVTITAVGIEDVSSSPDQDLDTPSDFNITTNQVTINLENLFDGGDGTLTYGFDVTNGDPAEFVGGADITSGGDPVVYYVDGNTLWGFVNVGGDGTTYEPGQGDRAVFAVDISNPAAATFTLYDKIDHAHNFSDENIQTLDLSGKIVVTDEDNDSFALSTVHIDVIDDVPVVTALGSVGSATLDETIVSALGPVPGADNADDDDVVGAGSPSVTPFGHATIDASALFTSSAGADGESVESYSFVLRSSAGNATSGPVLTNLSVVDIADAFPSDTIELFEQGNVINGRIGGETGEIALTISLDSATGLVTVEQYLPIVHPTGGSASPDEPITLSVGGSGGVFIHYILVDGDIDGIGRESLSPLSITIEDDGISASATATATVLDDEGQAGGIAGGFGDATGAAKTVSGDLDIDIGTDGLKSVAFAASLAATGEAGAVSPVQVVYVDPTTKVATLETINVAWTPSGNGGTLTGTSTHYGAGSPVFTLVVDATGHYDFTLNAPLSHPLDDQLGDPVQTEYEDNLDLTFTFTATDGDNDTATNVLTITVDDDTPDVDVAGATSFNEGTTGTGTWSLTPGADGFGLVQVTVGDQTKTLDMSSATNTVTFGAAENVGFGVLTVKADGTWGFAANAVAADQPLTFSVAVTDGDGDLDADSHSFTVLDVNSTPTAGEQALTVDDEGLADGIPGDPGSSGDVSGEATHVDGTLPHAFNADGQNSVDPINFALMHNVSTTIGTETVTYSWDGANNVLTASSVARGPIFTIQVDGGFDTGQGNYAFDLLQPILHPLGDNENDVTVDLTYQVRDSDGETAEGTLTVTIDDDTPVAVDTDAIAVAGVKPTLSAILVVDLSLSMGSANPNPAPGYATRLDLLQSAVQNLLSNPDVEYKDIVIVTFGTSAATSFRLRTDDAQTAVDEINSYVQSSLSAGTDYNAAVLEVMDYFDGNPPLADALATYLYFLTDGDPQSGGNVADPGAWQAFLNDMGIDSVFSVGFSGLSNPDFLEQIVRPGTQDVAEFITNPANLVTALEGSLPGNPSGNIFDDGGGFGADQGHVASISYNGQDYLYNGTDPQVVILDGFGGKLIFNFVDNDLNQAGDWDYFAPDELAGSGESLDFDYVLVDSDGDESEGQVEIDLRPAPTLSVNDVQTAEDAGYAVFEVSLDHSTLLSVPVDFAVGGGTATGGVDYNATFEWSLTGGAADWHTGPFSFAPGETLVYVRVPIINDSLVEQPDETFNLTATASTGTSNGNDSGTATILNDGDVPPPNAAPVANDDTVLTNITDGSPIVIPDSALLANDTDGDSDPLSIVSVQTPSGGNVNDGAGVVSFTPTPAAPISGTTQYRFTDVTTTTVAAGGHRAGEFEASDGGNSPLGGLAAPGTFTANLTNTDYNDIESSNNVRFQTPDPGNGDNAVFWAEFDIAEDPSEITEIVFRIEARQTGTPASDEGLDFGIYNYSTGEWEAITEVVTTSDNVFTVTRSGNAADYVSPDGKVALILYNEDDNSDNSNDQRIQVDNVELDVSYTSTPPFASGAFDYTASDGIATDPAHVSITGQAGDTVTGTGANEILIGRDQLGVTATVQSGSTFSANANDGYSFTFTDGAPGQSITQIQIDVTGIGLFQQVGNNSRAFELGSNSDVTPTFITSGDTTVLTLTFAPGTFNVGDELLFGIDADSGSQTLEDGGDFGARGVPFEVTFSDGTTLAGTYQPGPGNSSSGTVATEGDDTLIGNGGADILLGGSGNDILVADQSDLKIDGGAGTDSMQVGANFASGSDAQIVGVENVVLTTAGTTLDLSNQTEGFAITASSGGNTISAGAGADTVIVNAGTSATTWTIDLGTDSSADKVVFNHASLGISDNTVATISNFDVGTDMLSVTLNGTAISDGAFVTVNSSDTDVESSSNEIIEIAINNASYVTTNLADTNGGAVETIIANAIDDLLAGDYTVIVYTNTTSSADAGIYTMHVPSRINGGSNLDTDDFSIEHIATLNGVGFGQLDSANFVGAADPIVLDLGAPGLAFTSFVDGVMFDINADGVLDQVAWTAGEDGILAYDLDGSGKIENGSEIFTPQFAGGAYADGLDALASLDSNADGKIDAQDAAFDQLVVWQDANHDGVSDAGELKSLAAFGISSIDLGASATQTYIDGQAVIAEGSFTYADGTTGAFVEVDFDASLGAASAETDDDPIDVLDAEREADNRNINTAALAASVGIGVATAAASAAIADPALLDDGASTMAGDGSDAANVFVTDGTESPAGAGTAPTDPLFDTGDDSVPLDTSISTDVSSTQGLEPVTSDDTQPVAIDRLADSHAADQLSYTPATIAAGTTAVGGANVPQADAPLSNSGATAPEASAPDGEANGAEAANAPQDTADLAERLAALSALDSNGDGLIDGNDTSYDNLAIWQDTNQDGVADADELSSLADHGIDGISLDGDLLDGYLDAENLLAQSPQSGTPLVAVQGSDAQFAKLASLDIGDLLLGGEGYVDLDQALKDSAVTGESKGSSASGPAASESPASASSSAAAQVNADAPPPSIDASGSSNAAGGDEQGGQENNAQAAQSNDGPAETDAGPNHAEAASVTVTIDDGAEQAANNAVA
jgi:T1SS-143 domain-containing protein